MRNLRLKARATLVANYSSEAASFRPYSAGAWFAASMRYAATEARNLAACGANVKLRRLGRPMPFCWPSSFARGAYYAARTPFASGMTRSDAGMWARRDSSKAIGQTLVLPEPNLIPVLRIRPRGRSVNVMQPGIVYARPSQQQSRQIDSMPGNEEWITDSEAKNESPRGGRS